jgi:hypothetical protein
MIDVLYIFSSILAWAKEPWILSHFLSMAGNESVIRTQDYFSALNYISNNPIGM